MIYVLIFHQKLNTLKIFKFLINFNSILLSFIFFMTNNEANIYKKKFVIIFIVFSLTLPWNQRG